MAKAGKARCRLKTHKKSQMGRSQTRKMDRFMRKLDNGGTVTHHHTRQIIDRVKRGPELVKTYSAERALEPTKAIPLWAQKKESHIQKILAQFKELDAKGKQKSAMIEIGLRIVMMDGSSWLYHFRFHTWTRTNKDGITKDSFGTTKSLLRQMGHCQPLVNTLLKEIK